MGQILDLDGAPPFTHTPGNLPILVSFPHNSSFIPAQISKSMTDSGRSSHDTDWFLDRLYDVPELENAGKIVAGFSRYVIDLNRPSDDQSLYPGQTTTGIIPETRFDGKTIYACPVSDSQRQARIQQIWRPYHDCLENELSKIRLQHGYAILIEAHSIASEVPRLFEGVLPDFNVGTNNQNSCDPKLHETIVSSLEVQNLYTHVANARFIGGYITRNYGSPHDNVHAVQFELSQATYMDEQTAQWDHAKAAQVQSIFRKIMQAIVKWKPNQTKK